jgi:3-hydroxy-9,10-secoandrosta-1,3,5(10)-triene-9,17-dione monooxygenase reductase component
LVFQRRQCGLGGMSADPIDPLRDSKALRVALGRFATGVTIVTCRGGGGERIGLTANSFNSLSLAPPLVLWSLRRASPSLAAFLAARHFAINVLTEDQVDLSRHFASSGVDKFGLGVWTDGVNGVPLLASCAATFQCELEAHQTAGDHELFFGRVIAITEAPVPPLVFQSGHYHLLGEVL